MLVWGFNMSSRLEPPHGAGRPPPWERFTRIFSVVDNASRDLKFLDRVCFLCKKRRPRAAPPAGSLTWRQPQRQSPHGRRLQTVGKVQAPLLSEAARHL